MTGIPRPRGLVATLVGGVTGGGFGLWLSDVLFDRLKVGDLSDIGTGILLTLAGLLVGPGVGVTSALAVRSHDRALATGLLASPLVTMAVVGGFVAVAPLRLPDVIQNVIGPLVVIGFVVAALWAARWLATR